MTPDEREPTLQVRATVAALAKMFAPAGYFDICTVDSLRKVWGLIIPEREYETLRLLHCVYYAQMPAGTRDELMRMVTGYIHDRAPLTDWQAVLFPPPAIEGKATFFKRLLNA